MPVVKMNLTLEPAIAEQMRARAHEQSKPVSRYVADLVAADVRRRQNELAAEGYRQLAADSAEFAEAALPLGTENWPD